MVAGDDNDIFTTHLLGFLSVSLHGQDPRPSD
jgi:hypothetical protein